MTRRAGWLVPGCAAFLLGLAAASPTFARGLANSVAFTDSRGDAVAFNPEATDRPDITRVVVSNDVDGLITFRINLLERPALRDDMRFRIWIDADHNRKTGVPAGFEYGLVWEARCGGLCSPFPSMSFSYHPDVAVWTVSAEDLSTRRFRFLVVVETGIVYDPVTRRYDFTNASMDFAPDLVGECAISSTPLRSTCPLWNYGVRYGPARLVAKQLTISPARPVAGRRLTVGLSATRTDTGEPVASGRVTCKASVATAALRAPVRRFVRGRATCGFVVPANARGRRLAGSITVVDDGLTLTRAFARRVS